MSDNIEYQLIEIIQQELNELKADIVLRENQIQQLEKLGIVEASPHYREGRYLYLIHPTINGKRKREYIGANKQKQDAALKMIERFNKVQRLQRDLKDCVNKIETARSGLRSIVKSLGKEQPDGLYWYRTIMLW